MLHYLFGGPLKRSKQQNMTIIGVDRIARTKTADGWLKLIEVDGFGREVNKLSNVH
jgi:hypothetical protein